jgi:hypothetical protein
MSDERDISGSNPSSAVFKRHLGILILGIVCLFGTFSPWVTVAGIFSVTGNKSEWGITTLLTTLAFVVYGLSGLLDNPHLIQQRELFRKISLGVSAVTLTALLFLLCKYIDAVSDYKKSVADSKASLDNSDLGEFGDALNGVLDSLTDTIKPHIGIGFIACLVSVSLGLLISIFKSPTKFERLEENIPSKKNLGTKEEESSQSAQRTKKDFKITITLPSANKKIVISSLVGVMLVAVAFTGYKLGKDSSTTAQTIEKKSVNTSSSAQGDFELDDIKEPEVSKSPLQKTKSDDSNKPKVLKSQSPKTKSSTRNTPMQNLGTPEFITITGVPKKLHLDFLGVADSAGDVVTLYNYRFKGSLSGAQYGENISCAYDASTSRVGETFRCEMDLSSITPESFKQLLSGDNPFYFQIQAVSGSDKSKWSEPYFFDWTEFPQVAE